MHLKVPRSFSQFKWGLSLAVLTGTSLACPLLAQTVNPTQLPNPVIPTPSVPPTPPLLPNKPSPLQSPTQESPSASTVEPYKCEVNADKNLDRIPVPPPTQSEGITDKVPENLRVTRFEFVGNTVFSQDELASVTKNFIERPITFAELVQAVSEVTKFYNKQGYINSYAVPSPQKIQGGVVKIQVVEGGLESFQVIRTGSYQRLNLSYVCSRIGVGTSPLNVKRLLNALQLLQLDPLIKSVSAELKPGTRLERSVLEVRMEEANSFSSHLTLDNARSPSVGSFRRQFQFNEADLLGLGDGVNLAITNTDGSNALDFSYTLPLNANNGQLRLAAGTTWNQVIEHPFDRVDIKAAARYFNLTLRQPLVRTPTEEFALGLTAERRESDTSFLGVDFPLSSGADEKGRTRISALRFFQEWILRSEREVLAMRSQFSLGVGAFNATINRDGPDSRFFAWEGQARWLRQLAPDTSLSEEQWAKVQQTLQQLPLSPINAVRLRHLGDVLRILGALDKSKFLLKQSIAMASNLQLSQDQSAAMLSLGNTLQALGNKTRYLTENNYQINSSEDWCHSHAPTYYTKKIYEQALNYYGEAQEKASSPDSQFQALVNQLNLLTQLQKWPEFNQTSKKIEAQIIPSLVNQKIPKVSAIDYALINYAQSLACYVQKYNNDVPSWSNIIQLLETAVENAKNRGDLRTKAYALGYLGRIYEQSAKFLRNVSSQQELQERSLKAYKYTKEALVLAQSTTLYAPEIAYQWQWQLGRLLRDRGDIQGAIAAYSAAVETLNSLRSDLVTLNPNIQFDFKDEVEPVYRQLVDLLLQPEHENLGQARNVIEALQLAELNNFLRDVCVKVREIKIDKLDPKAAVIYPIILSDRLEVILSLPDGTLTRYSTPSPSEGFETFLETLNTILANKPFQNDNTASSLALPSLQEMYNWLIAPAETALKEKKVETLVFVLDGMLRSIPMAALYDGKQYLVEKYAIALTPSLQLLAPRNLEPGQIRVLAAGRTDFENNIPLPGWNNLVYVKNELEQIATVVPVEVLLNKTFTSKSLQTEINSLTFPIVHIATHGKFDLQAENTFIIAWDRTININELGKLLRVKDPSRLRDIELLVFSACQTATGSSRAILGMAGVAVRAGARSTVATLWNVNDKSTADLMVKLYQELKNSIDNKTVNKAEALRRAQLSLLKGDNERFRNPYYWASFVLVGNWL